MGVWKRQSKPPFFTRFCIYICFYFSKLLYYFRMTHMKKIPITFLLTLSVLVWFYSCEKDDPTIIDPQLSLPSVISVTANPNIFDSTYISCVILAEVSSAVSIRLVTSTIKSPDGIDLGTIQLKDDGITPDTVAGDNNFTGLFIYNLTCRLIGFYNIEVIAENISGLFSNTYIVNFRVVNNFNHNPSISNLIIPDSIRRPSGIGSDTVNLGFLQVSAFDDDGLCDIASVNYNSFRPSGSQSGFNEPLYDDGNLLAHGDTTAGDGKYSLIVKIKPNPSDTSIGFFRFEFRAKDRSFAVSNTLIDSIYVHR